MALNANALTTVAICKKWLKIPDLETSLNDVLEIMINGFSDEVEAFTGRKLKSQSITEKKHGRGSNMVLLHEWPVTAVSEVKINGDVLVASDYEIADQGTCLVLLNGTFPRGYNNIEITYTAGYTTIPADLQQAVLDLCFWKHRSRESGDIGRRQKGKGSESEQWYQQWPESALAVVMRYKRTEMPGVDAPVQNY